ncbi:hypothetical protein ACTA71_009349 [Dictyostelium dimigraforme]
MQPNNGFNLKVVYAENGYGFTIPVNPSISIEDIKHSLANATNLHVSDQILLSDKAHIAPKGTLESYGIKLKFPLMNSLSRKSLIKDYDIRGIAIIPTNQDQFIQEKQNRWLHLYHVEFNPEQVGRDKYRITDLNQPLLKSVVIIRGIKQSIYLILELTFLTGLVDEMGRDFNVAEESNVEPFRRIETLNDFISVFDSNPTFANFRDIKSKVYKGIKTKSLVQLEVLTRCIFSKIFGKGGPVTMKLKNQVIAKLDLAP